MYESYYGLERAPFTLSPDPRFLYAAPRTREAFAGVLHGILDRRGFVVLTGESGTGKSTLIRAVLGEIPSNRLASSLIVNPVVKPDEFLELAMLDFGLTDLPSSKPQRLARLNDFLIENHRKDLISVLIVDEAHTLTPALLEEVRLLTNYESSDTKLLQIVLSGHTELDDTLERHELRQLKQRIAIRVGLRPLSSPNDVGLYMIHRWRKAGAASDLPFLPGAISAITHYSQGIPRTINALCDNGLLVAYGAGKRAVDRTMIIEIARDMRLMMPQAIEAPGPASGGRHTALLSAGTELPLNGMSSKTTHMPVDEDLFSQGPAAANSRARAGGPPTLLLTPEQATTVEMGGSGSGQSTILEGDEATSGASNGSVIGQWASRFRKSSTTKT